MGRPCRRCRQRRLVCDYSEPQCKRCIYYGIQCPGYGPQYKWTNAVAIRGKLAGKKLPVAPAESETAGDDGPPQADQLQLSNDTPHPSHWSPRGLGDPFFRRFDDLSRYYFDYCPYHSPPPDRCDLVMLTAFRCQSTVPGPCCCRPTRTKPLSPSHSCGHRASGAAARNRSCCGFAHGECIKAVRVFLNN